MFTDKQKRFLELEQRKDEFKKWKEDLQTALSELVGEQGLNSYFQDERGTVYKLVECTGRFVHFDKFSYDRTKRPGERAGTLSVKEAEAHGFKVD